MNKTIVLDLMQKVKITFDVTSEYEYHYDPKEKNLTLVVSVKGLKANMQDDASAFESWAIVLKYYLKDEVNTITIDWERDLCRGESGYYHYNRFVYRLSKFVQTYSWARSAKNIPVIPDLLYCNVGNGEAAVISKHEIGSEGWLECKYVMEHSCEYDVMNHQFPVGLFDGKVSRETHYTTGYKSAIDIWAIKGNCLSIFELKKADNKLLGIISELMFYTNVLDDILSHRIMYEHNASTQKAIKNDIRGFKMFYEAYSTGKIKSIESVFLADNLHPLISNELIDFINDSPRWHSKNISFKHKLVD